MGRDLRCFVEHFYKSCPVELLLQTMVSAGAELCAVFVGLFKQIAPH